MSLVIAYLTQGKVRIKMGADAPRTLESPYAASIHDRSLRSKQRHAWKSEGDGFLSGQMLWGKGGGPAEGPAPVLFTSLSRGSTPGQLVYSLASGSLSALCEAENLGAEERRLWNDNRSQVQHINVCPHTGNVAAAATWRAAYGFNQPLIPVWKTGAQRQVQLPFMGTPGRFPVAVAAHRLPPRFSLISADNGIIADLYRRNDRIEAVVLAGDPTTSATLTGSGSPRILAPAPLTITSVTIASP